ncbi:septum formation initiator family protein [Candidatus Saccharibacteria bacterium]|nr:septum formation initiator family protein [Candidatus Saccharibacteria bacterium]
MFDKIKNLKSIPYIQELKDVRILGMLVFGVIVLLVSWSGVKVIETNYILQQQIARMEEETKLLELQNANEKLKNEYYKTDQYLELQARKQFGKAAPGETVLVVPESVALKYTKDFGNDKAENKSSFQQKEKPFYQKNIEAWMSFFFRRS